MGDTSGHNTLTDEQRWPHRACCGERHGGVYCPRLDEMIEAAHPSRPDRRELVQRLLAERDARIAAEARTTALTEVQALADEWQSELDSKAIRDENARYCWGLAVRELRRALIGRDAHTEPERER